MPRCAYFNPSNMPSGGPRMSHEPRHYQRKQLALHRGKRDIDRKEYSVAEIDMEYEEMQKEWSIQWTMF